jgi:hypothetical protein
MATPIDTNYKTMSQAERDARAAFARNSDLNRPVNTNTDTSNMAAGWIIVALIVAALVAFYSYSLWEKRYGENGTETSYNSSAASTTSSDTTSANTAATTTPDYDSGSTLNNAPANSTDNTSAVTSQSAPATTGGTTNNSDNGQ